MPETDKILGGNSSGLASAVDAAVEEAGAMLFASAEQIDLALGDREATPANMRAAVLEARKGRGRPKGARNKRTEELRDYLLSRYRHPVETLFAIQSTDPDILAAELGCTEAEAMALIVRAAAEGAPYVAGKMPVELAVSGKGALAIYLGGPAPGSDAAIGGEIGAGAPLLIGSPEMLENQGLGSGAGSASE